MSGPVPTALSMANGWSCAVLADGRLACWGLDVSRQKHLTPFIVPAINGVRQVALGLPLCVVTQSKTVECWGSNYCDATGTGAAMNATVSSPTPLAGLQDVTSLALAEAGGLVFGCAVGGGQVYCWGDDSLGELGDGRSAMQQCGVTSAVPLAVPVPNQDMMAGDSVSVGAGVACAYGGLLSNMWCWGQLPGLLTNPTSPVEISNTGQPTQVQFGADFICLLNHDGSISCWGRNTFGQLGNGQQTSTVTTTPQVVLQNAEQIAAGQAFACALLSDATVKCWGNNANGNIGIGSEGQDVPVPTKVPGLPPVASIAAGPDDVCVITQAHEVWCWGANEAGEIGNGFSGTDVKSPTKVVWNIQ